MRETSNAIAEALFGLALETNAAGLIGEQLRVLDECFIPVYERYGMIYALSGGHMHPYIVNVIKILARRRCAGELNKIYRRYTELQDEAQQLVPATVGTAFEMSEAMQKQLQEKLENMCGKKVKMEVKHEPELIGGIRVGMDGQQFDFTVKAQLEKLFRQLSGAEE